MSMSAGEEVAALMGEEAVHSGVVLSGGDEEDEDGSKEIFGCAFMPIAAAHCCPFNCFSRSSCRLILFRRIFSLIFSRSSSERIHSFRIPTAKQRRRRHFVQKRRVMMSMEQLSLKGHVSSCRLRNRQINGMKECTAGMHLTLLESALRRKNALQDMQLAQPKLIPVKNKNSS